MEAQLSVCMYAFFFGFALVRASFTDRRCLLFRASEHGNASSKVAHRGGDIVGERIPTLFLSLCVYVYFLRLFVCLSATVPLLIPLSIHYWSMHIRTGWDVMNMPNPLVLWRCQSDNETS